MVKKVTIIGSGSWGTALVKLFSDSSVSVRWLLRSKDQVDYITKHGHNPRYLSFVKLAMDYVQPFCTAEEAIAGSELVIFAVPSAYLSQTAQKIPKDLLKNKPVAVSIKGFVSGTGQTPGMYLSNYFSIDKEKLLVIAGPCHAEEVGVQKSTYVTISSSNKILVDKICSSLTSEYVHTVTNNDPVGVEYAAILKNIIGIASGVANGLHYGDNFQAVLVTNAMREASRFIDTIKIGVTSNRDLFQSAYFGDLLVTAYSDYSRNRTLGKLIGRGMHVEQALDAMEMVAEGFHASRELAPILKKTNINLPVINSVHRILHHHANPFHEFKLLEEQLN